MKEKKIILISAMIIILFIYIVGPYLLEKRDLKSDYLNKDVIRFHVRANSDKKEDQKLKLLVRDEILDLMDARLKEVNSVEESREIIIASMRDIEDISRKLLKEHHKDYDVRVLLRREEFPTRKYGNLVFPQGDYQALLVEIGQARGENWWCVMFPPLCFVDITHSVAIEADNENEVLNDYIIDESQPLRLKSKLYDLFKEIFM